MPRKSNELPFLQLAKKLAKIMLASGLDIDQQYAAITVAKMIVDETEFGKNE